ncbi:hypothetical protein A2U01_0092022, partial [Trifolium medium]|nr:hypothetical protein [Trifolium medium]
PPKCEFPHPIGDPILGSTPAPPPSRTMALIPLVGESEGTREKQWGQCSRTTREGDATSPPKTLRD